jgi:hypothetical protein
MESLTQETISSKTILGSTARCREDRHLLLKASLGLFLKRLNHHIPVFRDDIERLADFADERTNRGRERL